MILLRVIFVASCFCSWISIIFLSSKAAVLNLYGTSMSVGYTTSGYAAGLFLIWVFWSVGFGYVVGSFLAKMVRAKYMMVGSVVYWMVVWVNWLYSYFFSYYRLGLYQFGVFSTLSVALSWSMILALSADITYLVRYLVKRRKT